MSQSIHSTTKRNIFWFRRDLRLADNPALLAAIENCDELIAVFILDEKTKRGGIATWAYPDAVARGQYPDSYFLPGAADALIKLKGSKAKD